MNLLHRYTHQLAGKQSTALQCRAIIDSDEDEIEDEIEDDYRSASLGSPADAGAAGPSAPAERRHPPGRSQVAATSGAKVQGSLDGFMTRCVALVFPACLRGLVSTSTGRRIQVCASLCFLHA